MLIDAFGPTPDVSEFHRIDIAAPADVVYRALFRADFAESTIVKALLGLRSLPSRFLGTRSRRPVPARVTLDDALKTGFGRLAEQPGEEIVLGVQGRFWRPTGNIEPFRREAFSAPVEPGVAQAVWNFRVAARGEDRTTLSTETRVTCGDRSSRLKLRAYWLIVRPFSGTPPCRDAEIHQTHCGDTRRLASR
jgi:hypothetical protein